MIKLLSGDYGLVTTVTALDTRPSAPNTVSLRRFLAAARRPAYHVALYEIVAGQLIELQEITPPVALTRTLDTAELQLPGPKQGSARFEVGIDQLVIYFTGRAEGDLSGPFHVWEHTIAVPGIWPVDFAAAVRVRGMARKLTPHLPAAAADLAPYAR